MPSKNVWIWTKHWVNPYNQYILGYLLLTPSRVFAFALLLIMYKRFTVAQLTQISNQFLVNLESIFKKERVYTLRDLLKLIFKQWNNVIYWQWSQPLFRFVQQDNWLLLITDEKDRTELLLDEDWIRSLNALCKKDSSKITKHNKSVLEIIVEEYQSGEYRTILDKPYLVYDIETLYATNDLRWLEFELGYTIVSSDTNEDFHKNFRYVWPEWLSKFVDFCMWFDGYIVWFNSLAFDNPVIAYNAGLDDDAIEYLNSKSIDLFMFIWNLTNRRIWLNKVATWLVGLVKVLEWGGMEWAKLLLEYKKSWDIKILNKVKKYCKWDVEMTLGTLLYFIKYQEFYLDGEHYTYTVEEFVRHSMHNRNKTQAQEDEPEMGIFG